MKIYNLIMGVSFLAAFLFTDVIFYAIIGATFLIYVNIEVATDKIIDKIKELER